MSPGAQENHELPLIATLLTPEERLRVDAAGEGCYRTLHRETVEDLIQDLKSRQVQAVLVSVSCASRVASLVPRISPYSSGCAAERVRAENPTRMLALGHCGNMVDVRLPAGWRELVLIADTGDSGQRGVLSQLAVDLPGSCC